MSEAAEGAATKEGSKPTRRRGEEQSQNLNRRGRGVRRKEQQRGNPCRVKGTKNCEKEKKAKSLTNVNIGDRRATSFVN